MFLVRISPQTIVPSLVSLLYVLMEIDSISVKLERAVD